MPILDRMRFTVIEANTDEILSRDLTPKEYELTVHLSAPTQLSMSVDAGEKYASAAGINFTKYGQWVIPELETDQFGKIVFGGPIVSDKKVDRKTGQLNLDCTGFMGYPKGIPFLDNYNPIAVDPAEVFQLFWAHIQNFANANLGVEVLPASTGTQMLPGIGFDGNILSFDFFALFLRAADFVDCGDFLTSLARDLPLDLFEDVKWNEDRTELSKVLRLAYPLGGVEQQNLAFRFGENILDAEPADESEIEPVSDVIIRSWLPGKVYSSQLSNADMSRFRRVVMEEDANISSTERAAAWAKRKLTRRNVPKHFSKITVDPNHPNAPMGSFWVGDSIRVQAKDFPWLGDIDEWHRIISITMKNDEPTIELGLKCEGAFNYDPIDFDPDSGATPVEDPNMLMNGYFGKNLAGWYSKRGSWIRVATSGYSGDGCVRIDCDDQGEEFESQKVGVTVGHTYTIHAAVRMQEVTVSGTPPYTMGIKVTCYTDGGVIGTPTLVDSISQVATQPYRILEGDFTVPVGVNEITMSFMVNENVTNGIAFWDDARILP